MLLSRLSAVVPERLRPTLDTANGLARLFEAAGARLYLVGGVVRDLLADRLSGGGDLDFTTDAMPSLTEQILAGWGDSVWAQGKRFGTIGAAKGATRVEVTTHRAEQYGASTSPSMPWPFPCPTCSWSTRSMV
jgi:poly(A) polymerase